jgi:hypothetical protein
MLYVQIEEAYSAALAKSKMMLESHRGPLERIGRARPVLETIINFGEAVTDVSQQRVILIYFMINSSCFVGQP